jgi:hypothetical protein
LSIFIVKEHFQVLFDLHYFLPNSDETKWIGFKSVVY